MSGSNQSTTSSSSSAIGGSSSTQQMNYDTPAIQVGNAVRDGDQFVLLVKSRQSSEFQVWSSGDPQETKQLFRQARTQVDQLTTA